MRVAVVCGGFSTESDVSRISGQHIFDACRRLGHDAFMVEYDEQCIEKISSINPDVVFPIVQGKFHGDGAVQAMLELMGIPYIGASPQAAAIINHKTICKHIWKAAGIKTPDYCEYSFREFVSDGYNGFMRRIEESGLSLPIVSKAPTQGCRYGIQLIKDEATFQSITETFQYDSLILLEQYVAGRFITQGVIEKDNVLSVLPPVEFIDNSPCEFKTYYSDNLQSCNPNLSSAVTEEINETTLHACRLTRAKGFARLDYHISNGQLYLLEINAFPGLRPHSGMMECAKAAGYNFDAFVSELLLTAE